MPDPSSISPAPAKRWTFDEVWAAEFEPKARESRRRLSEHRTEAFLDVAITLCDEPVRQMTPEDMLHLDAMGNPFISGSDDGIDFIDCAGFIWQLHVANSHTSGLANLWRRHRFLRRLSVWEVKNLAVDICAYVDRMLLDPAKTEAPPQTDSSLRQEPKTHFLASMMVNLAGDIGHQDPMSGRLLSQIPLPRLLQYASVIASEKNAERDRDETDSLRSRCLARLNELNSPKQSTADDADFADGSEPSRIVSAPSA